MPIGRTAVNTVLSVVTAVPACVLLDAIHDSPCLGAKLQTTLSPRREEEELLGRLRSQSYHQYELLWVHGFAGVGKTAIVGSLAHSLIPNLSSCLTSAPGSFVGSTFFFSSENGATDHRYIFSTLAYRLSQSCPDLSPFILHALNDTPDILQLSLEEQCTSLIVQPVLAWESTLTKSQDVIMIIDGLEECDGGDIVQVRIINIIHSIFSNLATDSLMLRWKWVISSRSESWIQSTFLRLSQEHPAVHLHRISFASKEETELYIRTRVESSRYPSHFASPILPPPIPRLSNRSMECLLWQSNGYMAYFSSLLSYIGEADSTERLREVTSHVEYASFKHKPKNMFSQLDALYHKILARVPIQSHDQTKRVLSTISLMQPSNADGPQPYAKIVASLLGLSLAQLYDILYPLHSVVIAPLQADSPDGSFTNPPLSFHHKSFDAFLRNPSRSGGWSIDTAAAHADLAKCCLRKIDQWDVQEYAKKRWFIHCWRTDTGGDAGLDAAFGILPELYDLDFKRLGSTPLDRYFIEWLLRIQEQTMSEYLVLNPGPNYRPDSPPQWSYNEYQERDWPNPLSFPHPYTSGSSGSNYPFYRESPIERPKKKLPSRPTYILGSEPSKQVLLVPIFELKDYRRKDLDIKVIGPKEKCWDLTRGFRVTALPTEIDESKDAEDDDFRESRETFIGGRRQTMNLSEYDELVARSLAWEEENGGSDYEQLVAASLAWEEENGVRESEGALATPWTEGERTPTLTSTDLNATGAPEDDFPGLLAALSASARQHSSDQAALDDGLYEDPSDREKEGGASRDVSDRSHESDSYDEADETATISTESQTESGRSATLSEADFGEWSDCDSDIEILETVEGQESREALLRQHNGEESFEIIEREEAFH